MLKVWVLVEKPYYDFSKSTFIILLKFDTEYIGRMRDLPIETIEYKGHIVRYQKREAPEAFLKLAEMLSQLVTKKSK